MQHSHGGRRPGSAAELGWQRWLPIRQLTDEEWEAYQERKRDQFRQRCVLSTPPRRAADRSFAHGRVRGAWQGRRGAGGRAAHGAGGEGPLGGRARGRAGRQPREQAGRVIRVHGACA